MVRIFLPKMPIKIVEFEWSPSTIIANDHGMISRQAFCWTENVNSFPENIQLYIIFEIRVFSHFRLQSEKFPQIWNFPFEKCARKNEIKHMIEHAIKFLILWTVYNWSWMIGWITWWRKHVVLKYRTCSKIKYTEITCTRRNSLYMERDHVF